MYNLGEMQKSDENLVAFDEIIKLRSLVYLKTLYPILSFGKKITNASSSKLSSYNNDVGVFLCPEVMIMLSIKIGISENRSVSFEQFQILLTSRCLTDLLKRLNNQVTGIWHKGGPLKNNHNSYI